MKNMQIAIPVAVALVGISVATIFQGKQTERWGQHQGSELLIAMTEHIQNTPLEVEEWTGEVTKVTKEMEQQYERAHVPGHMEIQFTNNLTGKTMQVSLVCGPYRHIGVHTPDKCYIAAGYQTSRDPQQSHVHWGNDNGNDNDNADILWQEFSKHADTGTEKLAIVWCWGANGKWIAPPHGHFSRLGLQSSHAWYKLYIISQVPANAKTADITKANVEFMRKFMPKLNAVLFPPEKQPSDAPEKSSEELIEKTASDS